MDINGKFPCKECEEREQGCHDKCERYKEAKQKYYDKKQELKDMKKKEEDFIYLAQRKRQWRKKK